MHSLDPACRKADSQVKQLRGFYQHGLISVLVIGFLTTLNLMTSPFR
jgi:hypothetical protein